MIFLVKERTTHNLMWKVLQEFKDKESAMSFAAGENTRFVRGTAEHLVCKRNHHQVSRHGFIDDDKKLPA